VVLAIPAYRQVWHSALAYTVGRGSGTRCGSARSDRPMIRRGCAMSCTDLACAVPEREDHRARYERISPDHPDLLLFRNLTGRAALSQTAGYWLNRRPDVAACTREMDPDTAELPSDGLATGNLYQGPDSGPLARNLCDDLFLLTARCDGLATLTENSTATRTSTSWHKRTE